MESFADRLDVSSRTRTKFEPDRIVLQDKAHWFGTRLEVWETFGDHELPETVLFQHGIVINENIFPSEVRFAGQRPTLGRSAAGPVAILPAGLPYSADGWGSTRNVVVGMAPEVLKAAVTTRSVRLVELKPSYGDPDPFIQAACSALTADVREGCPRGGLYGDAVIAALAAHLVRFHSADPRIAISALGRGTAERERVRIFILDRLGESLTLQELAGAFELDIYSFSRWFKATFGIPPHKFILAARIELAKQKLLAPNLSIARVAQEAGFSSQSHLATAFRRGVGVSPMEFRLLRRHSLPSNS